MVKQKKILLLLLILLNSNLFAKIDVVASILPIKTFVEKIGGDKVNITLMVKPGNSPHTYEPKPSQMKQITKAKLYFAIGVEFENVWLKRFHNLNKNMKIIYLDNGIKKLPITKHSHSNKKHKGLDPHIWTAPQNVKVIAKNIYQALIYKDNNNIKYYKANYEKFLKEIYEVEYEIKHILKNSQGAKFMVFHPAWGYFAKQFHLEQIAIEVGGKNPKPKQLIQLIKEAKKEKVSAIFTAPEFSEKAAKQIARAVGVLVVKISPLDPNWSKNLIKLAKAIAKR